MIFLLNSLFSWAQVSGGGPLSIHTPGSWEGATSPENRHLADHRSFHWPPCLSCCPLCSMHLWPCRVIFFFQNANLDMSFPDEQPVLASPKADLSVWPPRPCTAQLLWSHPPPHSPVLTLPHHTVVCFHFCNIALSLPATPGPLHTLFPLLGGLLSLSLF